MRIFTRSFISLLHLICCTSFAASIEGTVFHEKSGQPIPLVNVWVDGMKHATITNDDGQFYLQGLAEGNYTLNFSQIGFKKQTTQAKTGSKLEIKLIETSIALEELIIKSKNNNPFTIKRLNAVEGVTINAGKKNEVITLANINANLATNNARQVFAKVAGINVWESDGGGLQLGIGVRGLSPNRTSNFNTRQNGYDISADALGYPESYYTPPTEAVERIEVIRGAASLQYGTQFGGMVNFKLKDKIGEKAIGIESRQTVGSFGLFNSFNSVGGEKGKWKYYGFFQHKKGNGWRPNSGFQQQTVYANAHYQASKKLTLSGDITHMSYLAQQAGGLTDAEFNDTPLQSNRDRNWFQVDWKLASLTLDYKSPNRFHFNMRNFGLLAHRKAVGFLGLTNRTDIITQERDLLIGRFKNIGSEMRLAKKYNFLNNPATLLIGGRYYQGFTQQQQGNGTNGFEANFNFVPREDNLLSKSDFNFPSQNLAIFAENLFNVSDNLSVTPGIRYEYINTEAEGYYRQYVEDLAGNALLDTTIQEVKGSKRQLALMGIGLSYRPCENTEIYSNFSQNYKAVNFNDFRVVNPSVRIDENLQDEKGYNFDLGIRGTYKKLWSYDISIFHLSYADRIGFIQKTDPELFSVYRLRTNIGDARTFGVESLVEINVLNALNSAVKNQKLTAFTNLALVHSQYVNTEETSIIGKKVELAPAITLKTGIDYKINNFSSSLQFGYTSQQFTDATNAVSTASAINGIIPSHYTADISCNYTYKFLNIGAGINNVTNNKYFTRRATGYPGPGIIPSDGRSVYLTVGVKL